MLAPGSRLAAYEVLNRVAVGGMGEVYRARHRLLDRIDALKVLRPHMASDEEFRRRFLREALSAARLRHPHIVTVYTADEVDGQLFLAMEYIDGPDLGTVLKDGGPLAPRRAARLLTEVAQALDSAHTLGLAHRDVKPGNVLVAKPGDEGEKAYLVDFGLTKAHQVQDQQITATGQVLGSLSYIAPEQIDGADTSGSVDQYALACVMYEVLTGQVPFPRDNPVASISAHLTAPRPAATKLRADLPQAIDDVLIKGMAIKIEDRYGSCTEFMAEASDALGGRRGRRRADPDPADEPASSTRSFEIPPPLPTDFPPGPRQHQSGDIRTPADDPYADPSAAPPAPPAAPPTSGPPMSVPPISGPPASGPPTSGPPASGPPASGPPASGPPASGPPSRPPGQWPPPVRTGSAPAPGRAAPPPYGQPRHGPPAPHGPGRAPGQAPGRPYGPPGHQGQPGQGQPGQGQPGQQGHPGQPGRGPMRPAAGPPAPGQVAPGRAPGYAQPGRGAPGQAPPGRGPMPGQQPRPHPGGQPQPTYTPGVTGGQPAAPTSYQTSTNATGPASLSLVVVGGPASGQVLPLAEGDSVLGTAGDLAVADPLLAPQHVVFRLSGWTVTVESTGGAAAHVDGLPLQGQRPLGPGQLLDAGASLLEVRKTDRLGRVSPDLALPDVLSLRAAAESGSSTLKRGPRHPLTLLTRVGWRAERPPRAMAVPLGEPTGTAIRGAPGPSVALARWMLIQAAALHDPHDLCLAVGLVPAGGERWSWVRSLPHARPGTPPLQGPHVTADNEGAVDLVNRLMVIVNRRREMAAGGPQYRDIAMHPRVLAVLDDSAEGPGLDELTAHGPGLGVQVLRLVGPNRTVPRSCSFCVDIQGDGPEVSVLRAGAQSAALTGSVDGVSGTWTREIAEILENND